MNCNAVRELLPLFAYDDLAADEARSVARHLADCPACQAEHAALRQTRAALDATPAPAIAIDLDTLVQTDVRREFARSRRWRRIALTVGGLAAALLLALVLQVEVQAGNGQFTIAWRPAPANSKPDPRTPTPEFEERLQLVREITRALAADVADRDERQQAALVRLQNEIEQLQNVSVERWRTTERDIATLIRTAFNRPDTGEER